MNNCNTPYTHKRGDSLDLVVTIPARFADGYFDGFDVASQIRTQEGGAKVADLECEWLDPLTTRSLRLKCIDTTSWPTGTAKFDVQFKRASDGFVLSTETAQMFIVEDVTRDD
jgi:hypothetical protein